MYPHVVFFTLKLQINMMHMGIVLALEILANKNATPEILNATQTVIDFEMKLAEVNHTQSTYMFRPKSWDSIFHQ